jgi:hypothetical protein
MIVISGEIHSSKNSREIVPNNTGNAKRPYFLVKSKSAKLDETLFGFQLNSQRSEWEKMISGTKFPITIVFHFRRRTRRKFDYNNISQGILDAMVRAGYIPDDDADHVIPKFVPYSLDKKNPGCEFWID